MMTIKVATIFGCAALALSSLAPAGARADEEPAAAAAEAEPEIDKALEAEIRYVEALIESSFPDFAATVIAETKKKWPSAEAPLFAIEVRGLLSLGDYEGAEKMIASLPDRKGSKYWAARLELANSYFQRGRKEDSAAIYSEFFKVFETPPKELVMFYRNACYAWGQILVMDKRFDDAVKVYENLIARINPSKSDDDCNMWCLVTSETCDMYLQLASQEPDVKKREKYLKPCKLLVDKLLWRQDKPLYFGRAIAMLAHVALLRGSVEKAQATIDEYMDLLKGLHDQIVEFDPDGKEGVLRTSPMPQCRYMLAKILWDEAEKEYARAGRDDEKIKALMFGEKLKGSKERNGAGAYQHALNVFVKYPESSWAGAAGELVDRIESFAGEKYGAKISKQITPEQMEKVRKMQFAVAHQKFSEAQYEDAIREFYAVLQRYPEQKESVLAIEQLADCYRELLAQNTNEVETLGVRLDLDAVEGYLAERFSGNANGLIYTSAGDAVQRFAGKEKDRGELARAKALMTAFYRNYRRHANAPGVAFTLAEEAFRAENWEEAIKVYEGIARNFKDSTYYAPSYSRMSTCWERLGERSKAITNMMIYAKVEKNRVKSIQATMSLAQMYKRDGDEMLKGTADLTNEQEIARQERKGSAQIIRSMIVFRDFIPELGKAIADPSTLKADRQSYEELKEAATFLVGDCWGRLTRPEEKLEQFRHNAASNYEAYLTAYPTGRFSTNAYHRLGTIYTALGDLERSKDALDRLAKAFPDSPEAKNSKPQLAKSLIEMGFKKEGTDLYAEMLSTDGAYTARQFQLAGDALVEARSWELANRAYEKAIAKSDTNMVYVIARAKFGQATALYKQHAYPEAREAIDSFFEDKRMASLPIAVDMYFLQVEVASEQGRTEKDAALRAKHFAAAVGAIKKVRIYWGRSDKNTGEMMKPQWEQDLLTVKSAEINLRKADAEEMMNLGEDMVQSCREAAAKLLSFEQGYRVTAERPLDKYLPQEAAGLERCYALLAKTYVRIGDADALENAIRYGELYLKLFPDGKDSAAVLNCVNQARAGSTGSEKKEEQPAEAVEDYADGEGEATAGEAGGAVAAEAETTAEEKETKENE